MLYNPLPKKPDRGWMITAGAMIGMATILVVGMFG